MPTPGSFDEQPFEDNPYGRSPYASGGPPRGGGGGGAGASKPFIALTGVGALLGALLSMVSTNDFISHLDRQVHSIHCSFIPGAGAEIGESGCRTVMLSPYSSLFRESLWGGLPISLLAVAVFAYLVMHTARLWLSDKKFTKDDSLYLIAAASLPVLMSVIYAFIAINEIGAVCKVCVGIYIASGLIFVGAVMAHQQAAPAPSFVKPLGAYAKNFGEGVVYVAVLSLFYVLFAPSSQKSEEGCGTLVKKEQSDVMIPMGRGTGAPAIAVVDPLCPACKGFDDRMRASDLYEKLAIRSVLFPLDAACNWMVKESLHPGACAVSEAMLCDKEGAEDILDYAFEHQAELRALAKESDGELRDRLTRQFPQVKGCLGSAKIKNQLNRSLRWAVANALPVLTPQLFVGDQRVCDEDTDLGLEYTVARMLDKDGSARPARRR